MLIQRRSPCWTTSTFGSAGACWRALPSARARAERLSRGLGRLGIVSERVVQRGHADSVLASTASLLAQDALSCLAHIAVASRGVEGHGPVKPRQPPRIQHGFE